MKPGEEALGDFFGIETGGQMLFQGVVRAFSEGSVVKLGPSRADDPELSREKAVRIESVKRGNEHPAGKVARRAEHNQGRSFLEHRPPP